MQIDPTAAFLHDSCLEPRRTALGVLFHSLHCPTIFALVELPNGRSVALRCPLQDCCIMLEPVRSTTKGVCLKRAQW